jgi:hypothetical protein
MLVEKKMRWTLGGKFELPTWFITRYWMEGEERRCRKCYEERETIEHIWN